MPEARDFLEELEQLPSDRQELFALRLFKLLPIPLDPHFLFNHRFPAFPSVISTPGVCGGSPRLIRTRIPIWLLEHLRQKGFSEVKILESYPTLTAADLAETWAYVDTHRARIDREIEENEQY